MLFQIKIDENPQRAIDDSLRNGPNQPSCTQLKGYKNTWRARVREWRIVYVVHDDILQIVVTEADKRDQVYARMKK